jgi:hypothetical protein
MVENTDITSPTGEVNITGWRPKLKVALDLFTRLRSTLRADVEQAFRDAVAAAKEGKEEDSQRARRTAARALFAYIEGVVYAMKQTALVVDQMLGSKTFTTAEIAVLQEKEYRLNQNGKAAERRLRVGAESNLRFAFEMFGRPYRPGYVLPTQSEGWAACQRAIQIRHRLTHPKNANDLVGSEAEYNGELVETWRWFNVTFDEALRSGYEREG